MTFLEILLTILAAVFIGILFYYIFKTTGPWGSIWTFILILILAGLAAEAWVEPFGPVYYDVAWIPTLFVILLFALLLAAATPTRGRYVETRTTPPEAEPETRDTAGIVLGVFFWILMLFLVVAVFWGIFAY
ncbi:MAG: hypothetical protein ACOCWA_02425 [Bacteroidota bacterium]